MIRTTLADPASRPEERWDDPARGTIRWKTLLSGDLTPTDSFTCGIAMLDPGDHFVTHAHAEPEIYFGIAGTVEVEIDGALWQLAPEQALYIPGLARHGIPRVTAPVRFFYCFARDRFDQITYLFGQGRP